jgi:type I restriction enzyme S subunit
MNIPALRFKDDDGQEFPKWEKKNISEILKIGSGKDYKKLASGDIPVYGTGGYMLSVNDYLYDGESVCIGRKGTIDKPVLLSGKFWTVDTLFYTHSFVASAPKFIYALFQNIDWKNYNEASGVPSLSKSTIEKIEVFMPSLPEQTKIANFLTAVDEKITLLTKKAELLSQYKKGVMQQIFSQELRFKDDDGQEFPEWEEKTLKDVLDIVIDNRGKTPPTENIGNPLLEVNSIGKKDINFKVVGKFVSDTTYHSWFRKHIKNGDILFSTVGATAQCSYFQDEQTNATIAQNIVGLRFKNIYNSLFMFYVLTEKKNNQKFKTIEMGAVQPSVKVSQMIHLFFSISSLPEQTKIANFLSAIDEKITNNQTQLDAIKHYKQGLLQQMFV